MSRPLTLIEHITFGQRSFPHATGAFTMLMHSLALACKTIGREVNQAGLGSLLGLTGRRNVQGETVARLDEFANDTLVRNLTRSGSVCAMASEELAVPVRLPDTEIGGDYAVVFDPLDGSSNIDVAVSVGTIFGVFRRVTPRGRLGEEADLLQPGRALVAAGYALYGSSTVFVYTAGAGVDGFTLDPNLGEFLLSHPDLRVPERGSVLSANMANDQTWDPAVRAAAHELLQPAGAPPRALRYVGSMVADAHRTLLKGGLFLYPADAKQPAGKLRLLYEAAPLAFVFEHARGAASDGSGPLLDRQPRSPHDRTPVALGSREDVERFVTLARSRANIPPQG
ncbi:MAG: class 1 fructose-bisphosphatase [Acidobacteria bacterium]|nr:class 1 fructose-bisphosphatase [Acidobacteriota bacterium]